MIYIGLDLATRKWGACVYRAFASSPKLEDFELHQFDEGDDSALDERIRKVMNTVTSMVNALDHGYPNIGLHIGIEGLPTHDAYGIAKLAELCGWVRCRLQYLGYGSEKVPLCSARKTLLRKLPRKGSKKYVKQAVDAIFGRTLGGDECDAFVIANHLASTHGDPFYSLGTGVELPIAVREADPPRVPGERTRTPRKSKTGTP